MLTAGTSCRGMLWLSTVTRLNIIKDNPIGNGLDAFRASFVSVCEGADASRAPDAIDRLSHEELRNLALLFLPSL
ncbi:hypothetical protein HYQ45_007590 [Verticillium longisporum]|uniref:Uncharacterized protein n=1 Tax=Verticillium longisporum TaxID=100787 RepID=A0A8I2ZQA0_VERLO|nr:hypothetical protein HYQ45_007590 [Verticillium longisporum]